MTLALTADNALFGHTSEDTAYFVPDYPYSWKLRTEIRYWVETTKHGDRVCSQTLNPKTQRWNKPKKSTYTNLAVLYLDEKGHVTHAGLGDWTDEATIATFVALTEGHLSAMQKANLAVLIGRTRAYAGVKFTIREGAPSAEEQQDEAIAEQQLVRAINVEAHAALRELG